MGLLTLPYSNHEQGDSETRPYGFPSGFKVIKEYPSLVTSPRMKVQELKPRQLCPGKSFVVGLQKQFLLRFQKD